MRICISDGKAGYALAIVLECKGAGLYFTINLFEALTHLFECLLDPVLVFN